MKACCPLWWFTSPFGIESVCVYGVVNIPALDSAKIHLLFFVFPLHCYIFRNGRGELQPSIYVAMLNS